MGWVAIEGTLPEIQAMGNSTIGDGSDAESPGIIQTRCEKNGKWRDCRFLGNHTPLVGAGLLAIAVSQTTTLFLEVRYRQQAGSYRGFARINGRCW
jgi:hypothetical protein